MGKITINEFCNRGRVIHGDKYDYSKVIFDKVKDKVIVTCPIHGDFTVRVDSHIGKAKSDCKLCSINTQKTNIESLIIQFKKIHDNKYDYSQVEYINTNTKIKILCALHNTFLKTPKKHLIGQGCPDCTNKNPYANSRKAFECRLIEVGSKLNNNKYDYSLVRYTSAKHKVEIICPIHGSFFQTPNKHKNGQGCPSCNDSNGEKEIIKFLNENNHIFIRQHIYSDCFHLNPLKFDFYLPLKNVCIEYNGIQHYKPVEHFGGEEQLILNQLRDNKKKGYCKKNNIPLIIVRYNQDVNSTLSSKL